MNAQPPKKSPSPPFASRELNGEELLSELRALRESQVRAKHLLDCAAALRGIRGMHVAEAQARIRQVAAGRLQAQPALANLAVRWASKLKVDPDVMQLASHFERLALCAALISAVRRGADRLRSAAP